MVLARYSVDKAVYRAKVEEVIEGELFSVRYIDYGNRDDTLTKADVYPLGSHAGDYSTSRLVSLNLKEIEAFTMPNVDGCA